MENINENVINLEDAKKEKESSPELKSNLGYAEDERVMDDASNAINDYSEIFSNSLDQLNQLSAMKEISDSYNAQLTTIVEQFCEPNAVTPEMFKLANDTFASLNKEEQDLTSNELDLILDTIGLKVCYDKVKNSMGDDTDDEMIENFKNAIVVSIIGCYRMQLMMVETNKEIEKIKEDFNKEMDDILTSANLNDQIVKLKEKIDVEEDEAKKAKMIENYQGLYSVASLDIIIQKIENKGLDRIKKECKKSYEQVKAKAIRRMKNDSHHYFMNPELLEETLEKLFPNEKEAVRIILYVIFRRFNKSNSADALTATFINYFILTVNKLASKLYANEVEENALYKSLKSLIEKIK